MKLAAAIAPLTISIALWGCGGGDDPSPPDRDLQRATVRCTNAMITKRSTNWRPESSALGRIGFFGTGRDFLSPRFSKRTKIPVVVEGHDPVTVSISPRDRGHARLVVGNDRGFVEVVEARFVPCRDRPETWWPAGFVLRNRQPVGLIVRQVGKATAELRVGRI